MNIRLCDCRARPRVGRRTVAEVLGAFDAVDVPRAEVLRIDETLADPQIVARGRVIEQDHPVLGGVKLADLRFRSSDCDTTQAAPAPLTGQHNRQIACLQGYSDADIDALVSDGVLYADEAAGRLAA